MATITRLSVHGWIHMNPPFFINKYGRIQEKGTLGFCVRERIGVAIVNPRGVARGKKSVIIGV